jgi:hypothetical protein
MDKKWILVLLGLSLTIMVILSGCISQQPMPTPTPTATATVQPTASPKMYSQAADEANWTKNADEIAVFLSGANPIWPEKDVKDLMHMHLSTTKTELVARYTKNYTADVQAYDTEYALILTMSDVLSDGIVKQFPAKF